MDFKTLRRGYERLLETVVILLVSSLTLIVVVAVAYRKAGASLSWYDEVASVLLAWLTYYGAALAALKRSHIGFPGLVGTLGRPWRIALLVVSEACVFGFFLLLAWVGWEVLRILEGDTLISLPEVPTRLTQSAIPVGALLFVVSQALSLPETWQRLVGPQTAGALQAEADEEGAEAAADGRGPAREVVSP